MNTHSASTASTDTLCIEFVVIHITDNVNPPYRSSPYGLYGSLWVLFLVIIRSISNAISGVLNPYDPYASIVVDYLSSVGFRYLASDDHLWRVGIKLLRILQHAIRVGGRSAPSLVNGGAEADPSVQNPQKRISP